MKKYEREYIITASTRGFSTNLRCRFLALRRMQEVTNNVKNYYKAIIIV